MEKHKEDGSEGITDKEKRSSSSSESIDEETAEMDVIRKIFNKNLKLHDSSESDEQPPKKILSEVSLDGIVEYIKENQISKIVTMAGAGISTSAGIPDFRSPSSGLYYNLQKYNLPHPQAIFELDFFMKNPEPFFTLAKELLPKGFKPTLCHYFIRMLWQKGLLLRHYTQNIDTLERMAGLPPEKIVEAHGTFYTSHCLKCRASYTFEWMKEKIVEGVIPKCEKCEEGVVKPDIVFFGEMLPDRFHQLVDHDCKQAELLIIMGSSLVVQPFASLVDMVPSTCPRLLLNKEKVDLQDSHLRLSLGRFLDPKLSFLFRSKNPQLERDVIWLGDCDTGCQLLADKLGWGDELKALLEKEHKQLDAENSEEGK